MIRAAAEPGNLSKSRSTMNRAIPAALALAGALSTAACNTTLAPTSGTITAGDLSAAAGSAAPSVVSEAEATAAQVRSYALAACGVLPTLTTIANIFNATSNRIATASNVADIVCKAVKGSTAYSADLPTKAKAKTVIAPVGSTVTGVAIVNGKPVAVTAKVVR
jgi:hypothetical protein